MDSLFIFCATKLYLFVVVFFLCFFILQKTPEREKLAILTIIYLPVTYIVAKIASYFYFDPRPFISGHITPLIFHTADNGFPSDHMLLTGALATILFFYNKKIGIIVWILALTVGLSRVYVGVHHMIDIVGSIVVVIITFFLVQRFIIPIICSRRSSTNVF